MNSVSEIRPVKMSQEKKILKTPGVTGVDIGYKLVAGKKTDQLSIRVFVAEKKDAKKIPQNELIPKTIKGAKVDVIERVYHPQMLLMKVADMELHKDTGSYDPLRGGMSIGPCRSVYLNAVDAACHGASGAGWYRFVGTLGAIVRDVATNDPMLLSNFHVMCVDDGWNVGDQMAQPSLVDGGACPGDIVSELQRASLAGQVDGAVARHTARGFQCSILDIGNVHGTATATTGMAVRKRGRTTGLTYGNVDSVDLTVRLNYCNGLGTVTLTNQVGIEVDESQSPSFGEGGDSGSVVVNSSNRVVGLYFAGSSDGKHGAANPIQTVLNDLNVKMCSRIKKREPDVYKKREPDHFKKREPDNFKKREPDNFKKREPDNFKKREPDNFKKREPDNFKKREPDIYSGELDDMAHEMSYESGIPQDSHQDSAFLEERLARIEAAMAQLTHFIGPELRPDTDSAPLQYEDDYVDE